MNLIEKTFPIHELNQLATLESKSGPARRSFRPIFSLHKWWARRLGSVFRTIIMYTFADTNAIIHNNISKDDSSETSHEKTSFSKIQELILKNPTFFTDFYHKSLSFVQKDGKSPKIVYDPFMGGGTTVIESLKYDCKVIGSDLNPLAWFIVKNEVVSVKQDLIERTYSNLEAKISQKIKTYFQTECKICQNQAESMYYFWAKTVQCPHCEDRIPLLRSYIVTRPKKNKKYWYSLCPKCLQLNERLFHEKIESSSQCEFCNNIYSPKDDYSYKRGSFHCETCGNSSNLIEHYEKYDLDKKKIEVLITDDYSLHRDILYAIEYYCPKCDKKRYKSPDTIDLKKIGLYVQEFLEKYQKNKLIIPKEKIPSGEKTQEIRNFGYNYFSQLFTPRQLLCISLLYSEILKINDDSLKELFMLTLSSSLEYNNKLCMYQDHTLQIENSFSRHAYYMKHTYIENNLWGSKFGTGSFKNRYKVMKDAKSYNLDPYERTLKEKRIQLDHPIDGKMATTLEDFISDEDKNCLILQGDSRKSFIPNGFVDAVITDPPYSDNVQYAELSDFFYVWLRLGLKDIYSCFIPGLTPKPSEIVVNSKRGLSDIDYSDGLCKVFQDCHRVLKSSGVLVFTFHHRKSKAWSSILSSIVESEFEIVKIYPIYAEMSTSKHINKKINTKIDIIFVCKKKKIGKKKNNYDWTEVENEIKTEISDYCNELNRRIIQFNPQDFYVYSMGIYLKMFSKYYPNIKFEKKGMKIQQLISKASQINFEDFLQ
jgi:putative DNA methylase